MDLANPRVSYRINVIAVFGVMYFQPVPTKHFTLKRKPKSAALRAELLQKSADAASNLKKSTAPTVPVRSRGMPRKMTDTTPLKGIPSRVPAGGFRSPSLNSPSMSRPPMSRPPAGRKDGGIKLLDINEQPLGYAQAKKRKRMQELEEAKRASEAAAAAAQQLAQQQNQTAPVTPSTPDYAVGLTAMNPPTPAPATPSYSPATPQHTVTTIITIPRDAAAPAASNSGLAQATDSSNTNQSLLVASSPTTATPSYVPQATSTTLQTPAPPQTATMLQMTTISTILQTAVSQATAGGTQSMPKVIQIRSAPQTTQFPIQQVGTTATTNNIQRKGLSLTREQMLEAQEMFRTANKVTRPEKALILGFMAGARDNPCPHLGNIVTIKLSENLENVIQPDDTQATMTVEVHFQMNYNTGEWKRIRKYRKVDDTGALAIAGATTSAAANAPLATAAPTATAT